MERKVALDLLSQCGILLQAIWSLPATNSTVLWDHHVRKKRVINTTPDRNECFLNQDVRYVVLLVDESREVLCTGSILTPRVIISVAHCVFDTNCFVESGGRRSTSAIVHEVLTKVVHQGFDQQLQKNDLALLFIKEPIDVTHSYHRTIKLYEGLLPPNSHGFVTGWGSTSRNCLQFPSQACSINVVIISSEQCQRAYSYRNTFTPHEVCTYYTNRTKCCWFGDSGAPLAVDGHLVGVFSWFRSSCEAGYPDVFMNLLHPDYRSWVKRWVNHFRKHFPH